VNANLAAVLYLVAGVLFILALRGLSNPASSRRGNLFGMVGMAIAIVTTPTAPCSPLLAQVNQRAESANRIIKLLGKVAELRHVGIFPRFEVMREWHEQQALPIDSFVIADGLHMNDWGYACFAQLLGDDIIRSVGQIKLGINVPSNVQTYRPM